MSWRLSDKFEDTLSFVTGAVQSWKDDKLAQDFVYAMVLKKTRNRSP